MTPAELGEGVTYILEKYHISISKACLLISFSRSNFYYKSKKDDTEAINKISALAEKHGGYGFWKLFKRLRKEGSLWNHKKVYRIYILLNLSMRRKSKKRVPARVKQPLLQPAGLNQNWSMDFMNDSLSSGRRFRTLNIIDDFNRELLHIEIATGLPAKRVIRVLEELEEWRGLPSKIRVDNGPEFIAHILTNWCKEKMIDLQFIQPGKPMQNGFIERFNKTYRNEILDRYLFADLEEVRQITVDWMEDYNNCRPHDSLDDCSPTEYAQRAQALTVDNSKELPTINTFNSNNYQ